MLLAPTSAGGQTYVLVPGSLLCVKGSSVEKLLRQESDEGKRRAILEVIYRGECLNTRVYQAVANVHVVSHDRVSYVCFQLRPGEEASEQCSVKDAVTTIEGLKASRKGNYRITRQSDSAVGADCDEGGRVMLLRREAKWDRISFLFHEAAAADAVDGKIATLLRQGCSGADY